MNARASRRSIFIIAERALGERTFYRTSFSVNVLINERRGRQELTMCMTQGEAFERLCAFSLSDPTGSTKCQASGCMGWKWLPKQTDARVAIGFCGMAT
jgi:hypothetical protein